MNKKRKIISITLILTFILQVALPLLEWVPSSVVNAAGQKWDYGYTGAVQSFTAPSTGKYKLETWGASGGHTSGTEYGRGGYSYGYYNLYAGQTLYIYVGEQGSMSSGTSHATFNGGAEGRDGTGSGGGATDIRTVQASNGSWYLTNHLSFASDASINSRLIVAGGAGGNAYSSKDGLSVGKDGNAQDSILAETPQGNMGYYSYKESSNYTGYIGAGGGGYKGGTNGRKKRYDNWASGGYSGSGYVGGVYNGSTSGVGVNSGNGKASISYEGTVQSSLIIETGDHATINGKKGSVEIKGAVGSTINLPTPQMDAGYYVRNILDSNGNVYSSNQFTYTFENQKLTLSVYADLQLNLSMQNGRVYAKWQQKDNLIKTYELYSSTDGSNFKNIILNSSNVTGGTLREKLTPINVTLTSTGSYTIENEGIYFLDLYGQQGIAVGETHRDDNTTVYGRYGSRSYGYVRLKAGDVLTSQIYSGGSGASSNPISGFTLRSGNGGSGIGLALNGNVIIAAGGGAGGGSGCYRGNGECQHWGDNWNSTFGYASTTAYGPNNSSTNGSSSSSGNYYLSPGSGPSKYGGGFKGGGGGGYPFGGLTGYSGGAYVNNSVIYSDAAATSLGGNSSYGSSSSGTPTANITGNFRNTYVEADNATLDATDTTGPKAPSNGRVVSSNSSSMTLAWDNNGDNGNKTYYYIKSFDANNLNTPLQTSNTASIYVESGVRGYYYYSDNNATGTVTTSNGTYVGTNQASIPRSALGSYVHIAAIDNAGNIGQTYNYKTNKVDVNGTINWSDLDNRYGTRPSKVTLNLYQNGTKIQSKEVTLTGASTAYNFTGLDEYSTTDNGLNIYTVQQTNVTGYEAISNQFVVTNTLILPTYKAGVKYTPVDSLNNAYLKNGQVKVEATVEAFETNRDKVGLNNGVATFVVDSGIQLDTSKLEVLYEDGQTGIKTNITSYTINGNTITIHWGNTANFVTKAGDRLIVKVNGTLKEIKEYSSSIAITGKLTDYRGSNTNIDLGQLAKTSSNISVTYQVPRAKIQIKNIDSITEANITDATFKLYEWNGNAYVEKETITDSNKDGIYESNLYSWNATSDGRYKVVQTGIPANHKNSGFSMEFRIDQLKTTDYIITPDYTNTKYKIVYSAGNPEGFSNTNGTVENEPYKLNTVIHNTDSQTKQEIQSNAQYEIYEWNKTTKSYQTYIGYLGGAKVEVTRGADKIYRTTEKLYYTPNNEGKFKIVQKTAPIGYYGDYDEAGNKKEYLISIKDKIEVEKMATGDTVTIGNNENNTFENKRTQTQVNINVIDKETKTNKSQGDATLQGVEYAIYAKEEIRHADGITTRYEGTPGLLYKKDELVRVVSFDENIQAVVEDLETGTYYIKQRTVSEGYLKNDTTDEIDVKYQNEQVKTIVVNKTYENQVKKQGFQIMKQQLSGESELTPLKDAGFTIYKISDLRIVKEGKITKNSNGSYTLADEKALTDERITKKVNADGSYKIEDLVNYYYRINHTEEDMEMLPQGDKVYYPYNMSGENLIKDYSTSKDGKDIKEIITGEDGYLKSPELAYGEYIVIETSVPKEKVAAKPFAIVVEEDKRELQNLRYILDRDFTTKIKIYLKDIETRNLIQKEGAEFGIQNTETGEMVIEDGLRVSQEGYVVTPVELPVGKYRIVQKKAAEGYVVQGKEGYGENYEHIHDPQLPIEFEIATNAIYYMDNKDTNVIVQTQYNKSQVGSLKVSVEGEYLESGEVKEEGAEFGYSKKVLEGVVLGVYAKEDVYTQDNQAIVLYGKDDLVAEITTNAEGIAILDNIPLGNYYVKEIKAINGFALNAEVRDLEFKYGTNAEGEKAQEVALLKKEQQAEDTRQKITISVQNIDSESKEAIEGTRVAIYPKENIVDREGKVIIEKDTKLQEKVTNAEGIVVFTMDLPLGEYYVKEIQASIGYVHTEESFLLDGRYQEDQRAVIEIVKIYESTQTSVSIEKIDEEYRALSGAKLEIVDEEGNMIQEWESTQEVQTYRKLEINKKYIIKEKEPIPGYVTIEPIEFRIEANGNITTEAEKQDNIILVMNKTTKLEISLVDKDSKERIEGVEFEIIQVIESQDPEEEDEEILLREFTTEEGNYHTEKLPIGKYILREKKEQTLALYNKGYVTNQDLEIEIKDEKEVQVIEVEQEVSKVEIKLLDKDTKEQVEGSKLQIVKEGTKLNEETNEEEKTQEVVKEWITGKDSEMFEKLPLGEYILVQKEIDGSKGYVTTEEIKFVVEDKREVQEVEMTQEVTKLEISIVDKKDKTAIVGSKLQILKVTYEEGKVVEEVVVTEVITEEVASYLEKLPQGKYVLRQLEENILDKGYIRFEDTSIELIDTREINKIEIEQDYTKVEFSIYDKDTKEEIVGATLVIQDKEGKEVGDSWISEGKVYGIEKLPVGEYTLVQKEAPTLKGYVKAKPVEFKIEETGEIQRIEMEEAITEIEIQLIDRESREELEGMELELKNEKGQVVATIKEDTKEEEKQTEKTEEKENEKQEETKETQEVTKTVLKKLPVGKYTLESTKVPYGYKELKVKIEVQNREGVQINIIEVDREEFDIQVEEWVQEIVRNGESEYKASNAEAKTKKVDIKDKKINTEDIKVVYKIRITNTAKITGQVGKIVEKLPSGMTFNKEDNKGYWVQEGNNIISTALVGKNLKEGAYTELELVLRWKNGMENFGTKTNEVEIQQVTSDIGFEESNKDNNKAKVEVIMGVGTGEVNLIWACIILLWILVPIELVISRRLKVKKFGLKDKTIKKYGKKQ